MNQLTTPIKFLTFLKKKIDKRNILQIRSLVDHERMIESQTKNFFEIKKFFKKDDEVFGIDVDGNKISSEIINQSLFNYYKKWSEYISNYGIINLEVYKQSFRDLRNNLELNEGAHFDFIQVLSNQYLVKAKT